MPSQNREIIAFPFKQKFGHVILILSIILLFGQKGKIFAQEVSTLFPYGHKITINPAYAGLTTMQGWSLTLTHYQTPVITPNIQNQNSETVTATIQQSNLDKGFKNRFAVGGFNIYAHQEGFGASNRLVFMGSGAYDVPLGRRLRFHHLRAGFQIGVVSLQINNNDFKFEDQFFNQSFAGTTQENFQNLSAIYPDLSVGVLFYKAQKIRGNPELNYFGGASLYHVNRPQISYYNNQKELKNLKAVLNGGLNYRFRNPIEVNTSAIVAVFQRKINSIVQTSCKYTLYRQEPYFSDELFAITLGANYLWNQQVSPFINIDIRNTITFASSFSLLINNQFLSGSTGGWSLGLILYLNKIRPNRNSDSSFDENYLPNYDLPFPVF